MRHDALPYRRRPSVAEMVGIRAGVLDNQSILDEAPAIKVFCRAATEMDEEE